MITNFVIDDSTQSHIWQPPKNIVTGLDLSERPVGEGAYGASADMFPDELLIPERDFRGMIEERKARKATTRDLLRLHNVRPKNQSNVNYCWIFAPTMAASITKLRQDGKWVDLSPASGGAQITNFKNVGGWGKTAIEWIQDHGLDESKHWPDTAWNNRSLLTAASKERALKNRCTKWWELKVRNTQQLISLLLQDFVVPIGLNWWGHEVLACDPDWVNGQIAAVILNSWGEDWGDEGWGTLQGQKMLPDDAVAPVNMKAVAHTAA